LCQKGPAPFSTFLPSKPEALFWGGMIIGKLAGTFSVPGLLAANTAAGVRQRTQTFASECGNYRADIDGLRAISVLGVLAFHLASPILPGGFVGVDVFFVISGYLITGIILKQIEDQRFSLIDFYVRRIKRIVPALLALIVFCSAVGFLILSPTDYAVFAKSALYAISAAGNFFFFYNTGYFDPSTDSMALLHTWSLGVEEQFYLLWPLLVVGLVRLTRGNRQTLALIFLSLGLMSFAANIAALHNNYLAAFYMPQNRGWELVLGGWIALAGQPGRPARWCSLFLIECVPLVGIAMIAASAVSFSKATPFPGYHALMPVLGAGAVLWPFGRHTLVSRVLASAPMVFVGLISYSLYLFHWPLILFYRHYVSFEPFTGAEQLAIITLSFFLAWASWRYIEQRYRYPTASRRVVFLTAAVCASLVAAVPLAIFTANGLPQRVPDSLNAINLPAKGLCPRTKLFFPEDRPRCTVGETWNEAILKIAIVGDSNAGHFLPIFNYILKPRRAAGVSIATCSPVVKLDGARFSSADPNYTSICDKYRRDGIALIKNYPEISLVILSSAWSGVVPQLIRNEGDALDPVIGRKIFAESLDETISEISAPDREIVVVADIPRWDRSPVPCMLSQQTSLLRRKCQQDTTLLDWSYFEQNQRTTHDLLRHQSEQGKYKLILPEDNLCNIAGCVTTLNGEFIYRDEGHLRMNLAPETLAALDNRLEFSTTLDRHIEKMAQLRALEVRASVLGKDMR
jgi:peptidoglycan/LPS O-acetylase OafA/YrhL